MIGLGLIARADRSGLANQTRNLALLLKPSKVMVIDSTPFNHRPQYFEDYYNFTSFRVNGFPTGMEVNKFLKGINAVLTCETFYNNTFVTHSRSLGVRTYNQFNYEFLDNLLNPAMAVPTMLLSPSYWRLEEVKTKFGSVEYLPPPVNVNQFKQARETNFKRVITTPHFLHVVGRPAIHDRNGTLDLLASLPYTNADFRLTIKAQDDLGLLVNDTRVFIDYNSPPNEATLYEDYDAVILPRRYGGLSLVMNEALVSGLPVIMTDIDPNNKVLPEKWLVKSGKVGEFFTRSMIDYYSVDHKELARKIDWLCLIDLMGEKTEAFEIGFNNYSMDNLKPKYEEVLAL